MRVLRDAELPRLVSGSDDGTLRTWDLSGSKPRSAGIFGGRRDGYGPCAPFRYRLARVLSPRERTVALPFGKLSKENWWLGRLLPVTMTGFAPLRW